MPESSSTVTQHQQELNAGDRFAFGKNWTEFLRSLNEARIDLAENSLVVMLDRANLAGLRFLDAGSGSGIMSLAAHRLGAQVHSFDFDPESVACTETVRERYHDKSSAGQVDDQAWQVETGSVLDSAYLERLGRYDIVYSWGVLHHTGAMWQALENVVESVADGGLLYIAIYNDQGGMSNRWRLIKRWYNKLPDVLRIPYAALIMGPRELKFLLLSCLSGKPGHYFANIRNYAESSTRGMSYWRDLLDWVGGYPFEVAKPEQVIDFYLARGFELKKLKTCAGSIACNEFVFRKAPRAPKDSSGNSHERAGNSHERTGK
jgi:2-polyprenyl-3-methyl-5-hydroxy-6-metoxy-1,4-benzoquinol methylase